MARPLDKPLALTPKEERFVEEYLVDCNATQAAIRAGYSEKTARAIGHELLQRPHIQDAIARAKQARSKRTEVTIDRVVRELARIAFFDPRRAYNEKGELLEPHDMPSDVARAIGSYDGRTGKVRFLSRVPAALALLEHIKTSNGEAAKTIELIIRDYTSEGGDDGGGETK